MSAPSEVHRIQLVKIQPSQRLTTIAERPITSREVTNVMKLIERTIQAVTQVKVLSPVMFNIIEADILHNDGKQQGYSRYGEWIFSLSGSKTMACIEMETM